MKGGILACLFLAIPSLPVPDIIFDVFEYGGSYKHLNSPMKFLPESSKLTEVEKPILAMPAFWEHLVLREAPFNLSPPLFGHCPNSNYTPPRTQTGTLGHFFSGAIFPF